jgi:hypothetical protein
MQIDIFFKMPKAKCTNKIMKGTTEEQSVTYKETPVSLINDFSIETVKDGRQWETYQKAHETAIKTKNKTPNQGLHM